MVNLLHLILTKFWSTDCPWGQLIITAPGTSTLTSPHCCHLLTPDQTCSKTFLFPFVWKDEIMFPPSFQIPRLHQTAACPGWKTPSIGISRLPKRKSGIEETSGGGEAGNPGNLEKAAGISPRWHSETWKWPKPFAVMASSRLEHESRFLKSNFQRQIQRQKQILFVLKRQRQRI